MLRAPPKESSERQKANMKTKRPAKKIWPHITIDCDVLSAINRAHLKIVFDQKRFKNYVALIDEKGTFFDWLHIFSIKCVLPHALLEGYEVHHRDKNPKNNRIENLRALHPKAHDAIHAREEDERREEQALLGWWRKQSPGPVKRKKPPTISPEQAKEYWERSRSPCLTKKQEDTWLEIALEDRLEDALVLAGHVDEKTPIPRNVTSGSFFDRESREVGIRPIRRGCTLPEWVLVVLVAALGAENTLVDLNRKRAKDIPEIRRPALDRMRQRPSVSQALDQFFGYRRLPRVGGKWTPRRMRDLHTSNALPIDPAPAPAS